MEQLSSLLNPVKFKIDVFSSLTAFKDNLKNFLPDLFLVDIKILVPGEFFKNELFQTHPSFKDIPILFIVENINALKIKLAVDEQSTDIITLPWNKDEILNRIETYLKMKRLYFLMDQSSSILEEKLMEKAFSFQHYLKDIEKINRQLTSLNFAKSEFLTLIYHELRTPLTSIIVLMNF